MEQLPAANFQCVINSNNSLDAKFSRLLTNTQLHARFININDNGWMSASASLNTYIYISILSLNCQQNSSTEMIF